MGKPNEWPMPAPRTQSQGEAFPVSHPGPMCTVGFLVVMCTVGFLGSPAESTRGSYSAPPILLSPGRCLLLTCISRPRQEGHLPILLKA